MIDAFASGPNHGICDIWANIHDAAAIVKNGPLAKLMQDLGDEPARLALRLSTILRSLPINFEHIAADPHKKEPAPMAEQPAAEIVQPTQQLAPIQSPAQPVALVRRDNSTLTPYALEPQSQKGLIQLALDLHESQLWQHKFKNAQQVGAVVMAGRSRGIPAGSSLRCAWRSFMGRALHTLCLASPDCEYMDLTEYSACGDRGMEATRTPERTCGHARRGEAADSHA